jgi:hypothetical protein
LACSFRPAGNCSGQGSPCLRGIRGSLEVSERIPAGNAREIVVQVVGERGRFR